MRKESGIAIRAVIFDLDDTLYPERDYVLSGYRAVTEHLHDRLHRGEDFLGFLRDRFFAQYGGAIPPAQVANNGPGESKPRPGVFAGAFDALNDHFGLGLTGEQILELVKVYREHVPVIEPYPSIPEMLGRLHADYRLGLLSDGYLPAQRLKFQALKLERFFDAAIFTEDFGRDCWKPSGKCFQMIAQKLGVPHAGCAYVADNPAKDFLAPNQLGWRTIQYLQPGQIHAAKAPPPGGAPDCQVRLPGDLHAALLAK